MLGKYLGSFPVLLVPWKTKIKYFSSFILYGFSRTYHSPHVTLLLPISSQPYPHLTPIASPQPISLSFSLRVFNLLTAPIMPILLTHQPNPLLPHPYPPLSPPPSHSLLPYTNHQSLSLLLTQGLQLTYGSNNAYPFDTST